MVVVEVIGFALCAVLLWLAYAVVRWGIRYQRGVGRLAKQLGHPPTLAEIAAYDHQIPYARTRRS